MLTKETLLQSVTNIILCIINFLCFCKVPLLLPPNKSRPYGPQPTRVVPGPTSLRHTPISGGHRSSPTTVWPWIPACATPPSSSDRPRGRPKEQVARLRPKSASATATIPPCRACMAQGVRMCTIYPSRTSRKPRRVTNTLSSTVTARG